MRADRHVDRKRGRIFARSIQAVIIALLVASVPGCSVYSDAPSSPSPKGLVAFFFASKVLTRYSYDTTPVKPQLQRMGYQVDAFYADNDVGKQISQIEAEIAKKPRVMVIAPIDGDSLGVVLDKAKSVGITVIAYDRLIMNTADVDYYAAIDRSSAGRLQARYIEAKLDLKNAAGPFNIELFAGAPEDGNAMLPYGEAMDILRPYMDSGKLVVRSGQTDFSKIGVPGWKSETAMQRMSGLLSGYYEDARLDAILSPNDSIALGVIAALDEAGYGAPGRPWPLITGQDCDIANVKAILAGKQAMSLFWDDRLLVSKVADMVDALFQGRDVPVNDTITYDNGVNVVPALLVDLVLVDKSNYKQVLIESGYYTADQLKP